MSRRKRFRHLFLILTLCAVNYWTHFVKAISCHECGIMYDGTNFMGISKFDQCQFFETEFISGKLSNNNGMDGGKYMTECPEADQCCFSLREYMSIDFWGHSAAAEVFLHGCCSSLNGTEFHHLPSTVPPPLATSDQFRAEILSQTVQSGHIQSRVMFCNHDGCNSKRIPWSAPLKMNKEGKPLGEEEEKEEEKEPKNDTKRNKEDIVNKEESRVDSDRSNDGFRLPKSANLSKQGKRKKDELDADDEYDYEYYYENYPDDVTEEPRKRERASKTPRRSQAKTRDREFASSDLEESRLRERKNYESVEDRNLIDLLNLEEGHRSGRGRGAPPPRKRNDDEAQRLAPQSRLFENVTATTTESMFRNGVNGPVCECNCNCPALICPAYQVSEAANLVKSGHHSWIMLYLSAIFVLICAR